jgi:hypothetical protein
MGSPVFIPGGHVSVRAPQRWVIVCPTKLEIQLDRRRRSAKPGCVRLATAAISEDRGGHNLPDKGTAWSLHEEHFAAYADRKCRAVPSLLRTNELNPDWGVVVETKGQSPLLAVDHRTGSLRP